MYKKIIKILQVTTAIGIGVGFYKFVYLSGPNNVIPIIVNKLITH